VLKNFKELLIYIQVSEFDLKINFKVMLSLTIKQMSFNFKSRRTFIKYLHFRKDKP